MSAADVKLSFIYVAVTDGGSAYALVQEEKLFDWYQQVENGEADILRFLSFTDQAKAISGKQGRVERMLAESTFPDEPEEEDGVETEPEAEWSIDWEEIK